MIKWDLYQECKGGSTSTKQCDSSHQQNQCQKSYDHLSICRKKQHPFIIKTLNKVSTEGIYLNLIKAIHDKPTSNITFNNEKMKASSPRSGIRQGYLLSPLLLNTVLEVLDRAIRQEKEKASK